MIESAKVSENPQRGYIALLNTNRHTPEHVDHILSSIHRVHDSREGLVSHPAIPHDKIVNYLHNRINIESDKAGLVKSYLSRKDAKAPIALEFNSRVGDRRLTPTDLHYAGLHEKKDMPADLVHDSEHAPHILNSLEHHRNLTKDHLHTLIDSIGRWSDSHNAAISGTMVRKLLDHPNINTSHINKILDKHGDDWMVHDSIEEHRRTPPSIHRRIMGDGGFWQPE